MNKAILKSFRPKTVVNILNGDASILVSKDVRLYKATMKLIEEQGYATFFMYCSKGNKKDWHLIEVTDTDTGWEGYEYDYYIGSKGYLDWCLEGKVVAKFTLRKVEELYENIVDIQMPRLIFATKSLTHNDILTKSCLTENELADYVYCKETSYYARKCGYAYRIEDLVIFDEPKELWEFYEFGEPINEPIMNAPQNYRYCFVESEE